jgi:branched-chain amino acid transport system substrate-binding protein
MSRKFVFTLCVLLLGVSPLYAQEAVRLAYVDALSGGGASVGVARLKAFQFIADRLNAKGGIQGRKLEIVPFDNKTNAQESVLQTQKAIDSGIRFITQGNGSAFGVAISEFIAKYNDRNPGKEVLYFNYSAIDPVLVNEKCNFWHFAWDANADVKMEAIGNYIKKNSAVKKVYLINQDYSYGKSVRAAARETLQSKRPDIEVVGDELHPFFKVTDFSPYIAKIQASGADSVITGNWGQDLALLLKAAGTLGLNVNWYTYYGVATAGIPITLKQVNLDHKVFGVVEGLANVDHASSRAFEKAWREKYGKDFVLYAPRQVNEIEMFAKAVEKAKSFEPKDVAFALEDMKFEVFNGGQGFMRKEDHQFFQPIYVASTGSLSKDEPFDEENTGWGNRVEAMIPADQTLTKTTCQMKRPAR